MDEAPFAAFEELAVRAAREAEALFGEGDGLGAGALLGQDQCQIVADGGARVNIDGVGRVFIGERVKGLHRLAQRGYALIALAGSPFEFSQRALHLRPAHAAYGGIAAGLRLHAAARGQ